MRELFPSFVEEVSKLMKLAADGSAYAGDDELGGLHFKQESYIPPFRSPPLKMVGPGKEKRAYNVSQYSGPLSYGRFKQESSIPPFFNPPVKTAGPPPPKEKKAAPTGMPSVGTQTKGPQLDFSPTKQLNASRTVAQVKPTKPSSDSAFRLNVKLPAVGTPMPAP